MMSSLDYFPKHGFNSSPSLTITSMETYSLVYQSRPRIKEGQQTILYLAFESLGRGPLTLDQLAKECEARRYRSTFKSNESIAGPFELQVHTSIRYHLKDWVERGIVRRNKQN